MKSMNIRYGKKCLLTDLVIYVFVLTYLGIYAFDGLSTSISYKGGKPKTTKLPNFGRLCIPPIKFTKFMVMGTMVL